MSVQQLVKEKIWHSALLMVTMLKKDLFMSEEQKV